MKRVAPVFLLRLGMSDTQKNRESIEAMRVAGASEISAEDEAELLEQALIQNVLGPESIRDREGNEITYKPASELIAAKKEIANSAASGRAHRGLMFSQLIPPGGGGTL